MSGLCQVQHGAYSALACCSNTRILRSCVPSPANAQRLKGEGQGEGEGESDEDEAPEAPAADSPSLITFRIPKRAPRGMGGKKTTASSLLLRGSLNVPAGRVINEHDDYADWAWSGSYDLLDNEVAIEALKAFELQPTPAPSPESGEGGGEGEDEAEPEPAAPDEIIRDGAFMGTSIQQGQLTRIAASGLHTEDCLGYEEPANKKVQYLVRTIEPGKISITCESGDACTESLTLTKTELAEETS